MSTSDSSVTAWIDLLRAGERDAARRLWQRFADRLIGLARARLRGRPRRAADEEDAALSAFDSFCRGAEQGRFSQLNDRGELWSLLVTLTLRKVSDQVAHERRQKRGGGVVRCETDLAGGPDALEIQEILSREPTPAMAAEMADRCRALLEALPEELRQIAVWRLGGYTNEEIAGKLDCARSTVQRKLVLIQARWQSHAVS